MSADAVDSPRYLRPKSISWHEDADRRGFTISRCDDRYSAPERTRRAGDRLLAAVLLRDDFRDGGDRRHHAADPIRLVDHRMAAGHRYRAAAVASRLDRRVREIPADPAIQISQ